MTQKPILIPYIPRIAREGSECLLFLPDMAANLGNIVCYAHMGQHGEASMDYYSKDTRAWLRGKSAEIDTAMEALIREYRSFLDDGEYLEHCERDMFKFRKVRWKL